MLNPCNSQARGLAACRPLVFAVCCAPFLVLGGCHRFQNAVTGGGDWVQFTTNEAGFTASYPSAPRDKVAEDGQGHSYGLDYANGQRYLGVRYDPHTDLSVPLADRLAAVRDKLHVTNMTITEVEVDGQKGLATSYERVREGVSYSTTERIFYRKGALYQVHGVMVKGSGGQTDAERFVASFHFLPDGAR